MTLKELLVKIGFDVDHAPLDHLEHKLEHVGETVEGLKERFDFLMGAEIAHHLFEVAEKFAEWGEQLNVTAQALGLNVESLQALQFAAAGAGVSAESMTHGMAVLSRRLFEAKSGGEGAAKVFARVGITPEQIASFKTADEALLAVSDRLHGMGNGIERTAVAQELLGRGGYQMIAFLAKGSAAIKEQEEHARHLGLILSGEQVAALELTAHAFMHLTALMRAFGAMVAAQIGPAFAFVIDKLIEFYGHNKDLISLNVNSWLDNVAYSIGFVAGLFVGATTKFIEFAKALHMEGDILKYVAGIGTIIGTTYTAITASRIFISVIKGLSPILTGARVAMGAVVGGLGLFQAAVAEGALAVSTLTGSSTALSVAFGVAGASLGQVALIAAAVVAAIGGIVVVVHDLYALFNGEPTWIGQFVDWVTSIHEVQFAIQLLKVLWEELSTLFSENTDIMIAALAPLAAAFAPIAGPIAAITVAGHDLYALFSGEPTWVGKFADWVLSLDSVKVALNVLAEVWDKVSTAIIYGVVGLVAPWVDFAKNVLSVAEAFSSWLIALDPVKAALNSVLSLLTSIATVAKGAFSSVGGAISSGWAGLKSAVGGVFIKAEERTESELARRAASNTTNPVALAPEAAGVGVGAIPGSVPGTASEPGAPGLPGVPGAPGAPGAPAVVGPTSVNVSVPETNPEPSGRSPLVIPTAEVKPTIREKISQAAEFFGITKPTEENAPAERLAAVSKPSSSAITNSSNVTNASNEVNQSINMPINITVPNGTDTNAVAVQVQEGIKEHLDRMQRETDRSLATPVAY